MTFGIFDAAIMSIVLILVVMTARKTRMATENDASMPSDEIGAQGNVTEVSSGQRTTTLDEDLSAQQFLGKISIDELVAHWRAYEAAKNTTSSHNSSAATENFTAPEPVILEPQQPIFEVPVDSDGVPLPSEFFDNFPKHAANYEFTYMADANAGHFFKFRAKRQGKKCRYDVRIIEQPSYKRRNKGAHETHRLGLPDKPRICFEIGSEPKTLRDACMWAVAWAAYTSKYIHSGKRF